MIIFLFAIITQSLTFLPLAVGISISYHLLRATDMTIDGSFVLGAAVFARLVTLGISPTCAALMALIAGALAGMMTATIQRHGKIDPLLAGVLATFILSSVNLIIMARPNIGLLSQPTLVSSAFAQSELAGWSVMTGLIILLCSVAMLLLLSRFGLMLRAFGDNPALLKRLGHHIERYRLGGFALSNALAAGAGCLTAQIVGYADVGMGFGVTLTGIGAIILGQQVIQFLIKQKYLRIGAEFFACLCGVGLYFFALNLLLRFEINPIYLKMMLGLLLIVFLRAAI
ncbi:MAG TPA: ABC transporter permease, partial [Gammaproteobacteria bacterium]|nr:ABC transporter permease [Gammaproteobacteria bacterium]